MRIAERLLKHPYTLIFSLFCGAAYYMFILRLLLSYRGGGFLMFIFAPAVICGAAAAIARLIKNMGENENYIGINALFWAHTALFIIAAVILAGAFV